MAGEEEKRAIEARLFRKLQTRDRLQGMAAAARESQRYMTPRDRRLGTVRWLLDQWVQWQHDYLPAEIRAVKGDSRAGWVSNQSSATSATEYLERVDSQVMQSVHKAVEEGLALYPEGVAMRIALRIRWLNESAGASVFRSNRLAGLNVDDLADRAELALVELLERRGLALD